MSDRKLDLQSQQLLNAMRTVIVDQVQQLTQMQAEQAQTQAQMQAEQAQMQAEYAKATRMEIVALKREMKAELAEVKTQLARIESNTIIIRDRVLSEFEGIQPDTKAAIEELALAVTEEEVAEEIVSFVETCEDEAPSKERTIARKSKVSAGKVFRSLNPDASKGELTAFGNWMGKQMSMLFGVKFSGWYHQSLEELVEYLTLFYTAERSTNGRMY